MCTEKSNKMNACVNNEMHNSLTEMLYENKLEPLEQSQRISKRKWDDWRSVE